MDGFEQREIVSRLGYYDDIRWLTVRALRNEGNQLEANGLVLKIRSDWNVD